MDDFGQYLPALPDASHLGARQHTLNKDSLAGLGFPQPPRISRNTGRFFFIGDDGEPVPAPGFDPKIGNYVDVVIVDVNEKRSKIYYDKTKKFDSTSNDPPLCWSDNGTAPSVNAIAPQSMLCSGCPQNVKGSAFGRDGVTGTWACKDQKKLAVLASGQPGTWLFTVPAASLTNYRDYVAWVAKQALPGAGRNADIADMVTRIHFVPGDPNVIAFRPVGLITREIAATQDKLLESGATDSIVGRTDQPRQGELPAPSGAPTASLQAPQVQPPPPPAPVAPAPAPMAPMIPFSVVPTSSNGQQPVPRKRRTKAEMEAARQPQPAATPATPAFLDPNQNPAAPSPPAPAQPQFGIGQPATPSADLSAAVADAFKLV